MANCWKCGRDNPAGMLFCTNCGATIPESPTPGSASDPDSLATLALNPTPQTSPTNWPNFGETYQPPTPPVTEGRKSRTGLIIGLVSAVLLLGLIIIGAGAGYYYYSRSEGDPSGGNSNQGVYTPSTVGSSDDEANSNASSSPETTAASSPAPVETPDQLFPPPTEPTKDAHFTVYANKDWQISDIAVVPEEEYTTTVDGIVDLADAKAGLRAGGTNDAKYKARRIFPEWPTGALLMRTRYANGSFSNTVAVSAGGATGSWKNLPDERGMLEFRINDNAPQNNGGQFNIHVKLTKVPKSKT